MLNLILILIIAALAVLIIKASINNSKIAKENIATAQSFLENNKANEDIVQTNSGLQYKYLIQSEEGEQPNAKSKVLVHYHGTLLDGTVFDSSVQRDAPISFGLNQVIPGWTEMLSLMKVGEKVVAYIPYNLAYGKRAVGKIPPASLLVFEIELLEIVK